MTPTGPSLAPVRIVTLLGQLTDLHIREPGRLAYGRIDTAPYLRTAVDSVLRLRQQPQAVVITGDLTDFGRATEYAHLAALLAPLEMPVYLLPGNHDDRDQMRRSFPGHQWLGPEGGFIQYSVQVGNLRLITLDTCEPGQSHGTLDAPRLQWLEDELESCKHQPVVIAMHHPLIALDEGGDFLVIDRHADDDDCEEHSLLAADIWVRGLD